MGTRRPAAARKLAAFGDFALFNTSRAGEHGETRDDIRRQLSGNRAVSFPERAIAQLSLYHLYANFGFVVSPHGRGLDCFRTWEALLMGAIPIVKHSPIDGLYDGFPVVFVEDWSAINERNLACGWIALPASGSTAPGTRASALRIGRHWSPKRRPLCRRLEDGGYCAAVSDFDWITFSASRPVSSWRWSKRSV